ncbi:MAG: hypothetical protein ACREIA_17990, partial [Opitutaceae bacterium]
LGWRLETMWDNVESLVREGGVGLLLKRPLACRGAHTLAAFSGGSIGAHTPAEAGFIYARRYVPLKPFAYWLRHGDLESELRARVPALAEVSVSEPEPGPHARGRKWLAGTATALLIAAGIFAGLFLGDSPAFNRVMTYALGGSFLVLGVSGIAGAVGMFRRRHFLAGALWSLGGVMLVLLSLAAFAPADAGAP